VEGLPVVPEARTGLVLVTGLDRNSTDVATRLLGAAPGTAVVHHGLREVADGVVHRWLRHGSTDTATVLELARGCVPCTLQDLLAVLHRLITQRRLGRIVVPLDPSLEPEPVCWALHHAVVADTTILELATVEAVLTVIDEAPGYPMPPARSPWPNGCARSATTSAP
jgi:CobW/HypB/UreG, nucleotide-binding domain